jgi:hypothetical protein
MGRSAANIVGMLPTDERQAGGQRDPGRDQEVESLRELRLLAGKVQAHIATALNIKQLSVSKIEKQTDMHLSTLRSYVEAFGGKLELTVKLPRRPVLRIQHLGDVDAALLKSTHPPFGSTQNGGGRGR